MADRESVPCSVCGAEPAEPCQFPDGPAPMVVENGAPRRVVHAARYALTLPKDERAAFWEDAVERYLSTELTLMNEAAAACPAPRRERGRGHGA